ncbi:hypothetical protein V8J36_08085 [Frigidibacter sp. MR17.14]|uniref:hypothetical protein n=1 Tax=Frigidibacter sp. MR17.14 TaxID=3126509 RepID=UPI003012E94C
MADIEIRAEICTAETEAGHCLVGFAVSEDEEDGYILFQQDGPPGTEPTWLEVSDEIFGAPDAVEVLEIGETLIRVSIRPKLVAKFGMVRDVEVRPAKTAEGWAEAKALLRRMFPDA